jgi:hypothetical protein
VEITIGIRVSNPLFKRKKKKKKMNSDGALEIRASLQIRKELLKQTLNKRIKLKEKGKGLNLPSASFSM